MKRITLTAQARKVGDTVVIYGSAVRAQLMGMGEAANP